MPDVAKNKTQIAKLENLTKSTNTQNHETKILQLLKTPTSTTALSKKLKIGRSYTSRILNKLEKQGKIYEHSKKGRVIFYKRK